MDEVDEMIAISVQTDDDPALEELAHELAASYPLAAFSGELDRALDDDESVLDPAILAGLVHV